MKTPWKIFSVACIATILPGSALAAELHIFSQSDTLYTYNTGTNSLSSVTTKDASGAPVKLSALAFDPNKVLWGQRPDQTNFTNGEFFTVDLTTGIVSYKFLMPINPALGTRGNMNTFDFRKNGSTVEILGFLDRGGGGQDSFERIDTLGNFIGGYNTVSNNPSFPAMAYDDASDTVYAMNGSDFNTRKYNPNADLPNGTVLGATGIGWSTAGGAFWQNDVWMSHGNASGTVTFGKVNKTSGAFSTAFTVGGLPVIQKFSIK